MIKLLKSKSINGKLEPPYNIKHEHIIFNGVENTHKDQKTIVVVKSVDESFQKFYLSKVARDLKEQLISQKIRLAENKAESNNLMVELPDGQKLEFMEHELDFDGFFFTDSVNVAKNLYQVIENCDIDLRRELYNKVVVTGGNSLLPEFNLGLERGISDMAVGQLKMKISSAQKSFERRMASWIGASIMASTAAFQNLWISKFEFDEMGENIIYRKCLN